MISPSPARTIWEGLWGVNSTHKQGVIAGQHSFSLGFTSYLELAPCLATTCDGVAALCCSLTRRRGATSAARHVGNLRPGKDEWNLSVVSHRFGHLSRGAAPESRQPGNQAHMHVARVRVPGLACINHSFRWGATSKADLPTDCGEKRKMERDLYCSGVLQRCVFVTHLMTETQREPCFRKVTVHCVVP